MSAHHRADVPGAPSRGRLAVLWWTAVGALALHNAEEGLLNLTGWVADTIRHPWFPLRALHGDQTTFTLALGLVTLAVVVLAAVAVGLRPRWSAEVL
ncbi:MAG TPA: hypothetical protein VI076_03080, partial [Actinopolymorphaceae bacterium]